MARRASFSLDRRMLVSKRSLLIDVALDAGCICSGRQSGLLQLETAMRVVAIAATHGAFQNLMMERCGELRLDLTVATRTKLRIVRLQHPHG